MALTDPELDLLRELLSEDAGNEVFLQVGAELNRRADWKNALVVLREGLEFSPHSTEGWKLLARAALETGDYPLSLEAWEHAGGAESEPIELAHVHILALERAGRTEELQSALISFERDYPGPDVIVDAVRERLTAPRPEAMLSASDPFLTTRAAERYVSIGRTDRALRVYRRILFRYPNDISVRSRIGQLERTDEEEEDDFTDLSEELPNPNLLPPQFRMPTPGISSASIEPAPSRAHSPQATGDPEGISAFIADAREAERKRHAQAPGSKDPATLTGQRRRRRRRSLLKR